jgi:hypothetical protein
MHLLLTIREGGVLKIRQPLMTVKGDQRDRDICSHWENPLSKKRVVNLHHQDESKATVSWKANKKTPS